jgi:predicted enzyme related to lactoylglutathione lyase
MSDHCREGDGTDPVFRLRSVIATLRAVSLDCDDPTGLMEFYARIMGGEVVFASDDFAALQGETAIWLTGQRVEGYRRPTWPAGEAPKQVHLEFAVEELEQSVAAAVAAGAVLADTQPRPESWQVLIDPAGHPFCLVVEAV